MIFEKKGQVLDLGADTEWDDTRVWNPSVIYKDNVFYLFYTGDDGTNHRIGLATSPDGVTFTKKGMVLDLGADTEWDDTRVWNPLVIYKDNVYYLFYTGDDGTNSRTGLATSPDGVTFTKKGMVLDLGADTEWDDDHVRGSAVIYKDNVFYLFYTGYDGTNYRIGMATSPDGVTFTKKGMVLDLGADTEWDDGAVYHPSVIYKDNVFYLFYTGYDGTKYRIGLATSPDGVTFTKKGMVLDLGADTEWDDTRVWDPAVIYKDNVFYLFYTGDDGTNNRIGLAVSNCTPLRIHEWEANGGTGTMNLPQGLNDGGWG